MKPSSSRPDDFARTADQVIADEDAAADASGRPPPQKGGAPALRPLEFARWVWRQLTSMRTALILLFLLAVAAIPGSLIPQERVDASAVASFKDRHPDLTPLFEKIGMFSVYNSPWFSAIYLLLMLSLVGCIVPRLRVYLRGLRARPPKAPRNLSRLSAYDTWTSTDPLEVEVERVRDALRRQRRRVEIYRSDADVVVSAEKGYLREAGNLLFHLALLVVLVGVAITGLFGFKGRVAVITGDGFSNQLLSYDDFTPGSRFDVDNLAPFSLTVDDFEVSWKREDPGAGTPLTFDAQLSVTDEPGATPYDYDLRVNHPLDVDGTSVFLVGHGYAPVVTITDGDGNETYSGPVVFLPQDSSFLSFGVIKAPFASPNQLAFEGYFFPTGDLCQGAPCSTFPDADNPVLSLVAYHGDLGLSSGGSQSLYVLDKDNLTTFRGEDGNPRALILAVGDTADLGKDFGSIRFDGYERWVQLQISHQPGKIVPLAGVWTAIIGLLGSLFVRPRRTWVRLRDDDGGTVIEVAALDRVSGGDPAAHVEDVAGRLRPEHGGGGTEEDTP